MAALLLLASWLACATAATLGDLARRDNGDVFTLLGGECGAAQCAEHGAGAASRTADAGQCACACPQRAPLFREDRELCVDDLPECSLATFGTGISVQRIPFVYLPLKGQIIHPSREITFQNVKTPICAVSGAQFLTHKGFLDLRNTLDADVPFSLFRDEGRTFLQWSGEDDVRTRMAGRVMVVRLLCRDVAAAPSSPLDLRGVFTPCVAFRVQGTPPRTTSNITEVQFAPNAQAAASTTSGLTVTEYVVIGISSLLLGLIYIASVFLYLHIRKRRKAASDKSNVRKIKGLKSKDGKIITERDIVRINNERTQTLSNVLGQDNGIIKKNPLLSRQYHDNKGFPSDSGSNVSDSEDFAASSSRSEDNVCKKQTTSADVHLNSRELRHQSNSDITHRDESGIERLPDEHVSIVETIDDREITRPVGTTRRKLYFNPAYFEPNLMAEPPPAALEFLTKIREVISIAKHKMASKRFHPVLNEIPEEETYPSNGNSLDLYGLGSQRSGSVLSLKRENSRKKINCMGCPGCKTDDNLKNHMQTDLKCSSCLNSKGDKQNSIRKWLENIPNTKQQIIYSDILPNSSQNNLSDSLLSLPMKESQCPLKKQNSFSFANSMYSRDNFPNVPKRSSTRSVRSEPSLRNYNIPLPDFENIECHHSFNHCQTVSEIDDDIAFNDCRSSSSRSYKAQQRRNNIFNNKNSLPDMVNEAIALEHCSKSDNLSSSDEEKFINRSLNIDEQNTHMINKSESPNGNDYETDSLERTSNKKRTLTPIDYLEIPSSQASPSLSNALPLEEELTMRNAVYKTHSSSNSNTPSPQRDIGVDQNHYETIDKVHTEVTTSTPNEITRSTKGKSDYSLVSEVYVNNNYNFGSTPTSPSGSECSMGSRKLSQKNKDCEEKPGCLTIEVKDPPENYIKIHESDGFEPDTLDRKHPKHKEITDNVQFRRKDLSKTVNDNEKKPSQRIQLRSSGTFKNTSNKVEYTAKFNSLRNDTEQNNRPKLSPSTFSEVKTIEDADETWDDREWNVEDGRILTLDYRHSKRQRQCTPPTIKQLKNLARPDILPPLPPSDGGPIYEKPIVPPRRVENDNTFVAETHSKNLKSRSLSPRQISSLVEPDACSIHDSQYGPSCSPARASGQSQTSEYADTSSVNAVQSTTTNASISCRNSKRLIGKNCCTGGIDTNTFVRGREDGHSRTKYRRKKGTNIEDSGYLSSDSTGSRQIKKKIVLAKIVNCSDTDDTENEARSESGAESTETHSVYFGSFRKLPSSDENSNDSKSFRSSLRNVKR